MADAIRSGSPAVPSGNIQVAGDDCPPTAEPVEVVDNDGAPDELIITFARGSFVTSTRTVYGAGTTSIQARKRQIICRLIRITLRGGAARAPAPVLRTVRSRFICLAINTMFPRIAPSGWRTA
jgi:hypothetical protein